MSQPLAVTAAPVFASFRARDGKGATPRDTAGDTATLDHRVDLLIDRLEQLEFTVGQLVAPDSDDSDDRLGGLEARLADLQARLPQPDATAETARAIETLAREIGPRQATMLDMLSDLRISSGETTRIAEVLDRQTQILAALPDPVGPQDAGPKDATEETEIATLRAVIEEMAHRQAAGQAQTIARFAAFERSLSDDVFETLAFRVSRLVDARMAASFARVADAIDGALDSLTAQESQDAKSAWNATSCLDDPRGPARAETAGQDDPFSVLASLSNACRTALEPR